MLELCILLMVIWFGSSLFVLLGFAINSENEKITILSYLKNFINNIFSNKNWFGVILSIIICLLMIPIFFYVLIIKILFVTGKLFVYIWKLGIKN